MELTNLVQEAREQKIDVLCQLDDYLKENQQLHEKIKVLKCRGKKNQPISFTSGDEIAMRLVACPLASPRSQGHCRPVYRESMHVVVDEKRIGT